MTFSKPISDEVTEPLLKLAVRDGDEDLPGWGDFGPLYQTIKGIVDNGSDLYFRAEHLLLLLLALRRSKGSTRNCLLDFGIDYIFQQTMRGEAALEKCVKEMEQGSVTKHAVDCLWVEDDDGELCLDIEIPYGSERGLSVGFGNDDVDLSIILKPNDTPGDIDTKATIINKGTNPCLAVKYVDESKTKKGGASK